MSAVPLSPPGHCCHLKSLGFKRSEEDGHLLVEGSGKDVIRALHLAQRNDKLKLNKEFITQKLPELQKYFASGSEIDPTQIKPELELIEAGTWQIDLFRLAALTWAVPVSNGFGRRLRHLVWDRQNDKLTRRRSHAGLGALHFADGSCHGR